MYIPDSVGVLNNHLFKMDLVFSEWVLKNEASRASRGCALFLLEGQDEVTAGLVQNYSEIKRELYFLDTSIPTNL